MDLGATVCRPKRPACKLCPWTRRCAARQQGVPERFPRKPSRRQGRLRRGAAFVALRRDGMVLVRTRARAGLLGGMTEVPTSDWSPGFDTRNALQQAPCLGSYRVKWRRLPGIVEHAFTHFPLALTVYAADIAGDVPPPDGLRWVPLDALAGEALPNVMQKVLAHGLEQARRTQE
jgi:A/G-specific adenine glycosylase